MKVNKPIKSHDRFGNAYDVTASQLVWRPSTYAIIIRTGHILLMTERGRYGLPGGGVDLGETPEAAVIREVKEETGLVAHTPVFVDARSSFFTDPDENDPETLTHFQSILLYYHCDAQEGEISADGMAAGEKIYGLAPVWVPIQNLDAITPGTTIDWRPIAKRALRLG